MISIIIPVYNVERYLRHCLNSVVQQSYADIQIICVDDGSSDGSFCILDEYAKKDPRIIVIAQNNKGVSAARNAGLKIAVGEQIMFIDADDWMDPDTCEQAIMLMRQHDADIVMWGYNKEYETSSKSVRVWQEERLFKASAVASLRRRLVGLTGIELKHVEQQDSLGPVWGKLYRRALFVEHNIQFIDLEKIGSAEDVLVNVELFTYARKVIYTPRIIHHYRKVNNESQTKSYRPNLENQWLELFSRIQKVLLKEPSTPEDFVALSNRKSLSIVGLGLNALSAQERFTISWRMLKHILLASWYRDAIVHLPLRFFPLHWKVFFFCAKYKMTLGVLFLLIIIRRLISK